MLDTKIPGITFKEPQLWTGRWTGAGALVPVAVANTTRGTGPVNPQGGSSGGPIVIARAGVGALTVTLPNPVGYIQTAAFWVDSPTADKNVRVTPIAALANVFTLQVVTTSTGAAVDVGATEELNMEVWGSISQNP